MVKRSAFTLIELLVVIAIIAVLMAVLMPALNSAKEQARGINCMANQKSLAQGYIMYSDDNDSSLVGGFASYDLTGIPGWVMPPLDGLTSIVEMRTGPCTTQQRQNGIRKGALYPYVKDVGAYHCPGDNRIRRGTSRGTGDEYRLYRSYSLSDYMRATGPFDPKKLFAFNSPANKMLFVEEIYDGAAGNYNHDGWSYDPGTNKMWDPLGVFHADACTFSFIDGHSEKKKWSDKRTVVFCRDRALAEAEGYGKGTPFNPPNEDLLWLDAHYPGKTHMAQ